MQVLAESREWAAVRVSRLIAWPKSNPPPRQASTYARQASKLPILHGNTLPRTVTHRPGQAERPNRGQIVAAAKAQESTCATIRRPSPGNVQDSASGPDGPNPFRREGEPESAGTLMYDLRTLCSSPARGISGPGYVGGRPLGLG